MKKAIVVAVIVVILGGAYYWKVSAPGPDLAVECYLRLLKLPIWTPLSRGYVPGTAENPAFISMRNDRYLVLIVSMPARRLLALETDEAGNVIYPEFKLTLGDGQVRPVKRVTAWPSGEHYTQPEDFENPEEWMAKVGDRGNRRYQLALMWRVVAKQAKGPFVLQMGDEAPIEVPTKKYNTFVKY